MLFEYLNPVDISHIDTTIESGKGNTWWNMLQIHTQNHIPNLKNAHIAIIGIENTNYAPENQAVNAIRNELYKLYNWHKSAQIIDLGNIKTAPTPNETNIAINELITHLLSKNIVTIVIGGTQDLFYGQFAAHNNINNNINLVMTDSKIDLLANANHALLPESPSFLYRILTRYPKLLNFTHFGYQRYLVDSDIVDTLEKLHFECISLGQTKSNIEEIEPILRNANLLSFNMSAVQYASSAQTPLPNGFTAQEACKIARYAGLSNNLTSIGIFDFIPNTLTNYPTAKLIAQMIWYFIEGFYARKYDYPEPNDKNFLQYIINFIHFDEEIIFLKSKITNRWWMKVPNLTKKNYVLVPCSYTDYEKACREEIPERWLKTYARMKP